MTKFISQNESLSLKLQERKQKRKQFELKKEDIEIGQMLIQEAVAAAVPGLKMQERRKKKQQ